MERFLYRLARSAYAGRFILKGALMLRVWRSPEIRPTMDIDMLGRTSNDVAGIVAQIREIMAVDVEADGFVFDPASIQAERITEDADYEGIRIRFRGLLDTARVTLQIDIGFGDIVYPGPEESDLPAMLDFPAPRLLCYSRESAIAEKFEAIRSPTQGQERFPSSEENLDAIPEERGRGACEPKSPITERSERHRHSDPAGGKMHYPSGGRRPANHSLRYRSDQS